MHRFLTLLCLLLAAACTLPAAALTVDVSGNTAGSPVTVSCDEDAFVVFQENNGTPVFAQGTTVRYIPHTTGTLFVTATAGGETATRSIAVTTNSGGGGGGGGGDSTVWNEVILGPGNFTVTAESGKPYTVNRRTALGALDASGTSYVVNDEWYDQYGTLYIGAINGRAGEGSAGWMYQVNGVSPSVGANVKAVQNGDRVVYYWSESMSSTPETSTDVIRLRVVFGSSDGGSSSDTGTGSVATLGPAAEATVPVGLPEGTTIAVEGGKTRISIDQNAAHDRERVTVKGDRVVIERPGLIMTVLTEDITERDGIATGFIKSVTAELTPETGTIEGIGEVLGTLHLALNGVPALAGIRVVYAPELSIDEQSALSAVCAANGAAVTGTAYVMNVGMTGLANGEDIAGATVRMHISPAWTESHGGADAIRIVHIADNGTVEMLETRTAGIDRNGDLIFEAASPNGLSAFALVSLGDAVPTASMTTMPTPATTGTVPVTTPAQTPVGVATVIAGVFIGGGAHLIGRKEE
ncbi:MAG: hypothetical protein PWP08_1808 [Methanofollis sp.]|nr:hypothetical protein [Methanofollis sp.]